MLIKLNILVLKSLFQKNIVTSNFEEPSVEKVKFFKFLLNFQFLYH